MSSYYIHCAVLGMGMVGTTHQENGPLSGACLVFVNTSTCPQLHTVCSFLRKVCSTDPHLSRSRHDLIKEKSPNMS